MQPQSIKASCLCKANAVLSSVPPPTRSFRFHLCVCVQYDCPQHSEEFHVLIYRFYQWRGCGRAAIITDTPCELCVRCVFIYLLAFRMQVICLFDHKIENVNLTFDLIVRGRKNIYF